MRQIREILRLYHEQHYSLRMISRSLAMSHVAVKKVVDRAQAAGYTWPLDPECTDAVLDQALYPHPQGRPLKRPEPDWSTIHHELQRKEVTLALLWLEYQQQWPDGYQYTQFCAHYEHWAQALDVVLRHHHTPGDKMFVDYAGVTVPIHDAITGGEFPAQVFVATLGASNYTFVEVQPDQSLASWIQGHVHAVEAFQGVPLAVVPDNLRSGVAHPDRYEPVLTVTYQEWAHHYHTTILPARVRKPRDKSAVEIHVKIVEQHVLGPLRHQTFFSLAEANTAVQALVDQLNRRPFQKMPGSRRTRWEQEERPALQALPAQRYEFAEWRHARVHIDYHIEVLGSYYSVPYTLVQAVVDVRMTATLVEIFYDQERVASHLRASRPQMWMTDPHHRPAHHQAVLDWTPDRFHAWAGQFGPATTHVIDQILATPVYPEDSYRRCLGILQGLGRRYGSAAVEAAAVRAVDSRVFSYRGIKHLCEQAATEQAPPASDEAEVSPGNIRGAQYYDQPGQALPKGDETPS